MLSEFRPVLQAVCSHIHPVITPTTPAQCGSHQMPSFPPNSSSPDFYIFYIFSPFIFEVMIYRFTRSYKDSTEKSFVPFTQSPPVVTSYVAIVQCQTLETDTGTVDVRSSVSFYHLCTFMEPLPQSR